MTRFSIGVMVDSFRLPIPEGIRKARDVGADGIQVYVVEGAMSAERLDARARKELKAMIAAQGLEISAVCGDLGGHGFQIAAEKADKVRRSKAIVDLAVDLGTAIVTTHIGAQGTVLGGGRYDGLIAELGGPPTAGIGWAGGIERLIMLANEPAPLPRPVVIAPLGPAAEARALGIARALRRHGIVVEQDYRGNMKRRMQRANKLNARAAIIIGDDELAKGVAQLKDLDSGDQREVALDALAGALKG